MAAKMKMMGPQCCCCPDYYVQCSPGGNSGWRTCDLGGKVYPDNDLTIPLTPSSDFLFSTVSFTVDYRNKLIFTAETTVTELRFYRMNFDLEEQALIAAVSRVGSHAASSIACDWQHQRIYFGHTTSFANNPGITSTSTITISRVGYNGGAVTAIGSETSTFNDSNPARLGGLAWVPTDNYLYYVYSQGRQEPSGTWKTRLKRVDATDGSGSIVVEEGDAVGTPQKFISRPAWHPTQNKICWIQRDTVAGVATFSLVTAEPDGSSQSTILSGLASVIGNFGSLKHCQKSGLLHFEYRDGADFVMASCEWDGSDQTDIADSTQGDGPARGVTFVSGFACKTETVGNDYVGGGYNVRSIEAPTLL